MKKGLKISLIVIVVLVVVASALFLTAYFYCQNIEDWDKCDDVFFCDSEYRETGGADIVDGKTVFWDGAEFVGCKLF